MSETNRMEAIKKYITEYKQSKTYTQARTAQFYFDGENISILSRVSKITSLGGKKITVDLNNAKIPTNFFKLLVIQQSSTLLNFGLQTKTDLVKNTLGENFDTTLAESGELCLIHGTTYLFWNYDNMINFPIYTQNGGAFMLVDEKTGQNMACIRFWQIAENKPIYVEVYEIDGQQEFQIVEDVISPLREKRPYIVNRNLASGQEKAINYNVLPIIELRANNKSQTELTVGLKALIDQFDIIVSDHSDAMARIKGILWVFNNFIGTAEDLAQIKKEVEVLGIVASKDGNSTVVPHTIDIPFKAVEYSLDVLRHLIYSTFMGYDTDTIKGGSLTNVAIDATLEDLNKKIGRWERQHIVRAVQKILMLNNIKTKDIAFRYDTITNSAESDTMVISAFNSNVIDVETALNKLSFIDPDEVQTVLQRLALSDFGVPKDFNINDKQVV